MENNFSKYILTHGGYIKQLDLPIEMSEGLGLCNPSVFIREDGTIACNIRRVNYMFHQTLTYKWGSAYGPTNYHHPDNDVNLRTDNYMCELDGNLDIKPGTIKKIEYAPYEPKWHFIGEEDVRIVEWDGKTYVTGCRRDTEDTGISRMELSELNPEMHEISRTRVPAPGDNKSYCEKNWMAILDMPYCYVKWCNPLEVVKFNPETHVTEDILIKEQKIDSEDDLGDIRGSSQVVTVGDYRIALVHEVNLWVNRYNERSAIYYTRFIVWDKEWNTVKLSQRFWFMNAPIEFTNGLAFDGKDFIIPFSIYDNAAFIARLGKNAVFKFIGIGDGECPETAVVPDSPMYEYISDIYNPEKSYDFGMRYFIDRQISCAHAFFLRSAELSATNSKMFQHIGYDAYYMCQKCLERIGGRLDKLIHQYNILIQWDPNRYEAYYELSRLYYGADENKNDHLTALGFASTAISLLGRTAHVRYFHMDEKYIMDSVWLQYAICCYRAYKDYEAVPILKDLLSFGHDEIKKQIESLGLNL